MSLSKVVENEFDKYKDKGLFGFLISVSIAYTYFTVTPECGKYLWPRILDFQEYLGVPMEAFIIMLGLTWHTFWLVTSNLILWIVYALEIPVLEKSKANDNMWP